MKDVSKAMVHATSALPWIEMCELPKYMQDTLDERKFIQYENA